MFDVVLLNDVPIEIELSRGISVYRLATELRKNGYSTFVIDYVSFMSIEQLEKIIEKVVSNKTKLFGVSSTWLSKDFKNIKFDSKTLKNIIKKYSNKTKLVIGGAYTYQFLEEDFDHFFIGHSENQIIEFLNTENPPKIIDWDRKATQGHFDFNSSNTEFTDIDVLHPDEILGLETSRGCIFNCAFCNFIHRGQNTKNFMKYEDTLYNELLYNYKKFGITRYAIIDDTFNDYTDKLVKIKSVVDRLPFQPIFWAYIRFDIIDAHPEQAQLLYDIGVRSAMHGLETWNDDTTKIIKKGNKQRKINGMKKAKEIWKDDVYINCFYIVGLPKDTTQDVFDFIDFYKQGGYKYIDNITAFPLYLRNLNKQQSKYAEQSEIEKNKENYGYTMIGDKDWIRNDEGDITSFSQAKELATYINDKCRLQKPNKLWSWHLYADRLKIDKNIATKHFFDKVYYKNLCEVIDGF